MPRMIAAVLLLLFAVGQIIAGPPEKASGEMVLDEVADGLRKYRKENDPKKRLAWLTKLAASRDVRVAIVLADIADRRCPDGDSEEFRRFAILALAEHFLPPLRSTGARPGDWSKSPQWRVEEWLLKNETDLRRRAKSLPQ